MNFLLEITMSNYKIWHAMAVRLNEIYPESRFAAIVGIAPHGEFVLDYLKHQKEIKYEFLRPSHEILADALKKEIDYSVLNDFENKSPQKSIWRMVCADRGWGSSFMHGALLKKTFINQNNSKENILRILSGSIKEIRRIFNEFKPDIFLPAIAMGSFLVHVYEQICKEIGIPYIVPTSNRIKNIFSFSSDIQLRFPQIDKTYLDLINGKEEEDLGKARELYEALMAELENPDYFDSTLPCFNIKKIDSLSKKIKFAYYTLGSLKNELAGWLRNIKLNRSDDIRRQLCNIPTLLGNILYVIKHRAQNYLLSNLRYGDILEPGQKYLYYPLHTSPEYSNQFQGTMWMDQIYLIELLAKSIPNDWIVYVKEHPATLSARVRPDGYFKKILSFPNVKMAPVDADTHRLIINAQMVAVVTGTSGWEAILRGKPLITFADNFWDVIGLSRKYSSVENISNDINEEIIHIRKTFNSEREKRLIYYLAAVLKHGFEISHPQQFCYEPGTDKQYELGGRETADALKKHLDFLKNTQRALQYR